jgi:hypothetical protein
MSHISNERIAQIIAEEKARKRMAAIAALHKVASSTKKSSDYTRDDTDQYWK